MKFLSIMCDMVRPNVLNFDTASKDSFEGVIKSLNGTLYTNCFSHGPDTGRSMGCYWSGCTPEENGCNTRAKYPKFYLKVPSFLDDLVNRKYDLYFFTNPNEKILGVLPPNYENIGIHNEDLDLRKFLNKIDMNKENIYVHIVLSDFHWALDDYSACGEGVDIGLRILKESINTIFDMIPSQKFDYIMIFSDHGFKYNIEYQNEEKQYLLNRDRSNTLMYFKTPKDDIFKINSKLCSLIDVYPTICGLIDKDYSGKGYSLLEDDEPDFIISEEHGSFRPQVGQRIEYWALIKKEVIYLRSYDGYYRDDYKDFELNHDEFDSLLCNNSISFKETYDQLNILKLYDVMASDKSVYTNGEKRHFIGRFDLIEKLRRKIRWNQKRTI